MELGQQSSCFRIGQETLHFQEAGTLVPDPGHTASLPMLLSMPAKCCANLSLFPYGLVMNQVSFDYTHMKP